MVTEKVKSFFKSKTRMYVLSVILLVIFILGVSFLSRLFNLDTGLGPKQLSGDGFGTESIIPPKCFGLRVCGSTEIISGLGDSTNHGWSVKDVLGDAKTKALESCNKKVAESKDTVQKCLISARQDCPVPPTCVYKENKIDDSGPCSIIGGEIESVVPSVFKGPGCKAQGCNNRRVEYCVYVFKDDGTLSYKCTTTDDKCEGNYRIYTCSAEDKWIFANPTCID